MKDKIFGAELKLVLASEVVYSQSPNQQMTSTLGDKEPVAMATAKHSKQTPHLCGVVQGGVHHSLQHS